MAMTHDYLDYLNQRVGIAPANSQEELQAAQTIARLMSHHDVEPQIEEFDAPSLAGLSAAILSVLMFVGVLVSGVGVLALTLIGFVLAVIPTVLVALRLFGRAPQLSFGPTARSQNVISVHRATGPLVSKGNRPIVVVAHYDTPRENFLYSTPVAPYLPMVVKASTYCRYVVALCALVQLMGFVPAPARLVLWLLGIVASLPAMLLAVGAIYERVSPCTLGANDNKASVASLLGVMENVRPSGLVPLPREPEQAKDVEEPEGVDEASEKDAEDAADAPVAEGGEAAAEPAEADLTVAAPLDVEDEPVDEWVPAPAEEVVGVRHGEDVLRELQILPEDCEIEYALGGVASLASEPARAVAPAPQRTLETPVSLFELDPLPEQEEPELADDAAGEEASEPEELIDAEEQDVTEDAPEPEDDESVQGTAPLRPVKGDAETTRESLLSGGRFSLVMDEGDRGVGPKDSSGLTAEVEEELDATQPTPSAPVERPSAPEDPEWGKSSYRPQLSNVARRASLFDLPDPSMNETDPLGDPGATRVAPSKSRFARALRGEQSATAQDAPAAEDAPEVEAPQSIETLASMAETGKSALGGLFGRLKDALSSRAKAAEDVADDSSDEESDDPIWRGGAATRGGLRFVEEDEQAPTEDELRDAALSLADDALVSHDIWFVALGGSTLDHAGMRSFLQQHRSEIRGSFIVNLDCVGAGELSVLTHEGVEGTRRADRRLGRLLSTVAKDLHAELAQKNFSWTSTDAWPAMSSSMRSVTIMGVGENGLPALSKTADDVAENVSGDQANLVTEIVTEAIRRA